MIVTVNLEIDASWVFEQNFIEASEKTLFAHSLDCLDLLKIAVKSVTFLLNFSPIEGRLRSQARPLLLQSVNQSEFASFNFFFCGVPAIF